MVWGEKAAICTIFHGGVSVFGADQPPLLSARCARGLHASQDIIFKINIGQPTIKRLAIASNFIL